MVGHQDARVHKVAHEVVDGAAGAERLVAAVVAHDEERPEHGTLRQPVQRPDKPAGGRGDRVRRSHSWQRARQSLWAARLARRSRHRCNQSMRYVRKGACELDSMRACRRSCSTCSASSTNGTAGLAHSWDPQMKREPRLPCSTRARTRSWRRRPQPRCRRRCRHRAPGARTSAQCCAASSGPGLRRGCR
jgi:hypothetical protein